MTSPGVAWGRPATGPPDAIGSGSDSDLAALAERHPGACVRFDPDPDCDLARAVGLGTGAQHRTALPIDGLRLDGDTLAVNMVVLGRPPDRLAAWERSRPVDVEVDGRLVFAGAASTVVIASGQFLRGRDVVPRGHPGDGRLDVQVYALARRDRRAMRRRLGSGTHVPHPGITTASGRRVRVRWGSPAALEVDGIERPRAASLTAEVVPEAVDLLV